MKNDEIRDMEVIIKKKNEINLELNCEISRKNEKINALQTEKISWVILVRNLMKINEHILKKNIQLETTIKKQMEDIKTLRKENDRLIKIQNKLEDQFYKIKKEEKVISKIIKDYESYDDKKIIEKSKNCFIKGSGTRLKKWRSHSGPLLMSEFDKKEVEELKKEDKIENLYNENGQLLVGATQNKIREKNHEIMFEMLLKVGAQLLDLEKMRANCVEEIENLNYLTEDSLELENLSKIENLSHEKDKEKNGDITLKKINALHFRLLEVYEHVINGFLQTVLVTFKNHLENTSKTPFLD